MDEKRLVELEMLFAVMSPSMKDWRKAQAELIAEVRKLRGELGCAASTLTCLASDASYMYGMIEKYE